MNNAALIFLGGGLGSLARYGLGKGLAGLSVQLPYGTLAANVLASLILGIFTGWIAFRGADTLMPFRAFLAIGFCGGFSTFSTFSNDTVLLLLHNRWGDAFFNIALNVVLCLGVTFLGISLGKALA